MTRTTLASALLLSMFAACATVDDSPSTAAPHEMTPTASFRSRTGTTVEIFAIGASGYLATELGDASLQRSFDRDDTIAMTPSQLYAKATGTTEVPPALAELSARVAAAGAIPAHTVTPAAETAYSTNQCTASNFVAQGYCPTAAYQTWCLLDWTGGAYEYTSDTIASFSDLCVKSGNVLWQIKNGDGGFHQYTVMSGQHFWYELHDTSGTWLHYDVLDAKGDVFQFGGENY